jgi:quinol monooxygenase YgiN
MVQKMFMYLAVLGAPLLAAAFRLQGVDQLNSGFPAGGSKMTSIHPYFEVLNMKRASRLMRKFVAKTRKEKGPIYYGWSYDKSSKTLFCREAYVNGQAVLDHMESVSDLILKMTGGVDPPTKLQKLEFHGPASELKLLEGTAKDLNAKLFTLDSGISFMEEENKKSATSKIDLVSIHPYFTVNDEVASVPLKTQFVEQTATETHTCVYYGWTKSGSELFCREAYVDGDAVLAHLGNVGNLLNQMTNGTASLTAIEFHGPLKELHKLKGKVPENSKFFVTSRRGFQRFVRATEFRKAAT